MSSPPTLPPGSLSLDKLTQLGFWDAFLVLPGPVEAAIIAGMVALPLGLATLFVSLRSLAIAKQAKQVAEQKLFADLLKVRMEWHEGFKAAVSLRRIELEGKLDDVASGKDIVATRMLEERRHEARWFFDDGVCAIVSDMINEFAAQRAKIIEGQQLLDHRAPRAKQEAAHHAFNVGQLLNDLSRALNPFLFVGHIKQTRREAKAGPRISGMFRRP